MKTQGSEDKQGKTDGKAKRTRVKKPVATVTLVPDYLRGEVFAQARLLEGLVWKRFMMDLTPELRQMVYAHDRLEELVSKFDAGRPVGLQEYIDTFADGETVLTGSVC